MANPGLIKNFIAEDDILPLRIVTFGSADGFAKTAVAGDACLGVSVEHVVADAGRRVDVIMTQTAEVKAGGTIERGDLVGAGAEGVAIKVTDRDLSVGVALVEAVTGDVFTVFLK